MGDFFNNDQKLTMKGKWFAAALIAVWVMSLVLAFLAGNAWG